MRERLLQNNFHATKFKMSTVISLVFLLAFTFNAKAQTIWLRSGNSISTVNVSNTANVTSLGEITGVAAGQTIEGMDFRPLNGQLYILGYESASGISQVYTVNRNTLAATAVGNVIALEIGHSQFGFDFNPTVDRIRVTTAEGKNYRLHPGTGAIAATDGNLAYAVGDQNEGATPAVGSVAYSNSYIGTTSTTMYTYDDALKSFNTQNPPNNGTQNTIGYHGLTGTGSGEMDIYYNSDDATNTAYFKLDNATGDASELYTINLTSGTPTLVGTLGTTTGISDIAVQIDVAPLEPVTGQIVFGLTSNSYLISFDSENPGVIRTHSSIGGITTGQVVAGLDSRPATGQLYALGYNTATGETQLYTINQANGAATAVGAASTLATGMTNISFDFNPTVDRIRVTSAQDNNYRLHPVTGAIAATDGTLAYMGTDANAGADPNIGAGAYTNSYIGATGTQLFGYDVNLNVVTLQNPPNNGTLNTIGSSGITVNTADPSIDMDFFYNTTTGSNRTYLVANTEISTFDHLYTLNLTTGAATEIGKIGNGSAVTDIAVQIVPNIPQEVEGQIVYGLTSNGYLITFDSEDPSIVRTHQSIGGVTSGQVISGLDSRPATGQLYALGYNAGSGEAQLYTIDESTGAATAVGAASTLEIGMTNISFDFNPTVDRIRVTSAQNNNYRLHPVTGALAATDGNLNYNANDVNAAADPSIGAGAYTNSYIGATATQLFGYDTELNIITLQNPPNDGVLNTIGASGILLNTADVSVDMDFYFDPITGLNQNYLIANTGNATVDSLYTINLTTGAVNSVGKIGNGIAVSDIAVKIVPNKPAEVEGQLIYGVTSNNYLISFDSEAPEVVRTHAPISGIAAGQVISGLDVRPATGELYALGYNSTSGEAQLYTINPDNAAATSVAVPAIIETNMSSIGFDFNPTVDRIRVVSTSGNNYRLHPVTGAVAATDGDLAYNAGDVNNGATPSIGSVAYTNSYGGSNNTKLFVYDDVLNVLALQNPPNNGTLNTIGSSTIVQSTNDASSDLDIYYDHVQHTNAAFMIANTASNDDLYTINTTTGVATLIGKIGNGIAVRDIAIRIDSITAGVSTNDTINATACDSYLAPDGKQYTASGTYTAIIPNTAGYDSLITIILVVNTVNDEVTVSNGNTLTASQTGGTYQWINCDTNTPIAGATEQIYVVSVTGNYAVMITSAENCTDTSDCINVTITSTKDIDDHGVKIFPNPGNGLVNITLEGSNIKSEMIISDIRGVELMRKQITDRQTTIDLTDLINGTYIIRIGNNVQRLVKQ